MNIYCDICNSRKPVACKFYVTSRGYLKAVCRKHPVWSKFGWASITKEDYLAYKAMQRL